jgi:CubicO group peptidase (beta-lactamase class C family)
MADAAIADDPRPLGDDYAVGYGRDIFGAPAPFPFVTIGGIAPAGSALTSGTDMARYLIAQMNGGVLPEGRRVVSAANLAALHRPGVEANELSSPDFQPDTASLRYAMGWIVEEFTDGRRLVWHTGGIDGFSAVAGFLPAEQLGFAVLTNLDFAGSLFYLSVQASLLSRLFGLNRTVPAFLAQGAPMLEAQTAELAAQTRPVDPAAAAPYLGLYEEGFRVRLDEAGGLRLDHDIRSLPLLALPDGTYVVASGPDVVRAQPVAFATGADGVPVMTIQGFAPVRWLTGG